MKLKDLKPNHVIKIETKREARKIKKLTGKDLKIGAGCYLEIESNTYTVTFVPPHNKTILPASQFLKKTNKQRIKVLEIQMGESMDQVESLTNVIQVLSRYVFEAAGLGDPKDFKIESLSDVLNYVDNDKQDFLTNEERSILIDNDMKEERDHDAKHGFEHPKQLTELPENTLVILKIKISTK